MEQFEYSTPYEAYKHLGMQLEWTKRDFEDIKLCDMDDKHIKNVITMLNTVLRTRTHNIYDGVTSSTEAWVMVLTDVQNIRRTNKLLKIKNKIYERQNRKKIN